MKFNIAIAQINPKLGNLPANLETHYDYIQRAIDEEASLVVFPELSLTGYWLRDQVYDVALKPDADFWQPLLELSWKISLVVGFVELSEDFQFYNSQAYIEDGHIVHIHRKIYLPTYGMFEERRFFSPGQHIRAFDTKFGRVGMLVCNDWWHATGPLILAQDGATLMLAPTNSPIRGVSDNKVSNNTQVWESLMKFHSKVQSSYVVLANRVGFDDGVGFWGGSGVWQPNGHEQARAGLYQEELLVTEFDNSLIRFERIYSPLVRDERNEVTMRELQRLMER